jgi:hypothetical protein
VRRILNCGLVVTIAAALALGGCGDSDPETAPTTTVATETSTSVPSVTTTTTPDALPQSLLTAAIGDPYSEGDTFDSEQFGIAEGVITAEWYAVGNYWGVLYRGLTPEDASGKCLGTSLKQGEEFAFVTNSTYGALGCSGFTTKLLPPGSVHLCDDKFIIYTTEIATSEQGDLYASIEQSLDDGTIQGMTSSVKADPGKAVIVPVGGSNCQVIS